MSIEQIAEQMDEEMTLPLGRMTWGTCYNSRSYYGHKPDKLKSGVQKYLRRREEKKMLWCIGEIYLFKFADPAAKAMITNLVNRLIIMLDEEMVFSEWAKYLLVRAELEKFEASGRNNFLALVKAAKILVRAEMLRLNSDIAGYFHRGMKYWGITPPTPSQTAEKMATGLGQPGDEFETLKLFGNFVELCLAKDPDCFYWVFRILDRPKVKGARRFRRTDAVYIIWEWLFKQAKGNEYLTECLNYRMKDFFNKGRKERFIFLTASVMLVMHHDDIDWTPTRMKYGDSITADRSDLEAIFKDRQDLVFDEYVIDMHCSEGRKKGRNKLDFIASGAVVVGENKRWFVKEWRDVYNGGKIRSFKKAVEARKKRAAKTENVKEAEEKAGVTESARIRAEKAKRIKALRGKPRFFELEKSLNHIPFSEFKDLETCWKNPCGKKAMCMFATYEGEQVVLKEGRKSMFYNRDYEATDALKEKFDLNKIGMVRIRSDKIVSRKDTSVKSWVANWELIDAPDTVYCMMKRIPGARELQAMKTEALKDQRIMREYLKIGMFRGILRVSDFNPKNVLMRDDGQLVSIDEGEIGKRAAIFGPKNRGWLTKAGVTKETVSAVLAEINSNKQVKKELIARTLRDLKFNGKVIGEVFNNYNNLETDLRVEGLL